MLLTTPKLKTHIVLNVNIRKIRTWGLPWILLRGAINIIQLVHNINKNIRTLRSIQSCYGPGTWTGSKVFEHLNEFSSWIHQMIIHSLYQLLNLPWLTLMFLLKCLVLYTKLTQLVTQPIHCSWWYRSALRLRNTTHPNLRTAHNFAINWFSWHLENLILAPNDCSFCTQTTNWRWVR